MRDMADETPASIHNGVVEKEVNLKAALSLRDILSEDHRYDDRLTRENVGIITLEQRIALARDWGAKLFMSIHTDAVSNDSVRGAMVYTLSPTGAAQK